MRDTLKVGATCRLEFEVPASKTVPMLYPEAEEFREMPDVFATGFFVGLLEWCCIKLLRPHYQEGEGSLGIHVDISHVAPTPPGHIVTVEAKLTELDGRTFWFDVSASDGAGLIGKGRHQRAAVFWDRFNDRIAHKKAERLSIQGQVGN